MPRLLSENEPPLFEAVNPNGDAPVAPVLIGCDHAGRRIPKVLGDLGLAAEFHHRHIAYDIGARQVAQRLAGALNATLLLANYSRLVIDLNRHPNDPTLIIETGDGVAIPGNTNLSDAERRARIDEMFIPYHQRYGKMVDKLQTDFARPVIISVHSFAPEINGVQRPWDIGLLWDEHRDLAQSLIANLRAHGGNRELRIGQNQPYHARDPLGYAMLAHAQARGVEMALIEIRQDHITDPAGQQWAADLLQRAFAPLLGDRAG